MTYQSLGGDIVQVQFRLYNLIIAD